MTSGYPDDIQFAGLVEAATAAADAHQRDLGKRKRGDENAYIPVSSDIAAFDEQPKSSTLSNSAAVLFREPSEKSKKYSRPPLGKVFTSLELAPEAFLKLQNAAKDYMLTDEHPERKDVVGHKKHNSNNDQAKLKLYQCVEDFLQQDNNGETFFGHSVNLNDPEAPPRTFFWPEDRNKIVKLLMPLLRKMVTNERQRIYAAETRKQEPKKSEGRTQKVTFGKDQNGLSMDQNMAPEIDPSLQADFKDGTDPALQDVSNLQEQGMASSDNGTIMLRINIITREDGVSKHVIPEYNISSEHAGSFEQFIDELRKNTQTVNDAIEVKALLPLGLIPIKSETDWDFAKVTVLTEVWMNSQLQIVVEI